MNTNWEYITVVEVINATGYACQPLILMAGKCILHDWFEYTNIEQGYHIEVTESGYMTNHWYDSIPMDSAVLLGYTQV